MHVHILLLSFVKRNPTVALCGYCFHASITYSLVLENKNIRIKYNYIHTTILFQIRCIGRNKSSLFKKHTIELYRVVYIVI